MTIPTVTFPIPQDQIKANVERLSQFARGLSAELSATHALIRAIRDFCQHPNRQQRSSNACPDCGWAPDYD